MSLGHIACTHQEIIAFIYIKSTRFEPTASDVFNTMLLTQLHHDRSNPLQDDIPFLLNDTII